MRSALTWMRIPLTAALVSAGLAVLGIAAGTPAAAQSGPAPGVTPAVITTSTEAFLFYTGTDGSVSTTDAYPTGPQASLNLGGHLISAPTAIWTGSTNNDVIVFGQGTDNQLWARETTSYPYGWSAWQPLGGAITSKPGAADVDGTTYSVFARGADGAVWERDHSASAWGPWHSLGGQVLAGTGPAAAYTAAYGQTWAAVTGTDLGIWYLNLSGNIPQSGWASVGGRTNSGPGLTAPAGGTLAAFARGTDNAGFYNEITGGARGWHSIGGRLTSGLAAAGPDASGQTYVTGLGSNGDLYYTNGAFPQFGAWNVVLV